MKKRDKRHCLICDKHIPWVEYDKHVSAHWERGDIKVTTQSPYRNLSPEDSKSVMEDIVQNSKRRRRERSLAASANAQRERWDRLRAQMMDLLDHNSPPVLPPLGYPVDEEGEPCDTLPDVEDW
jgi:hypothetical protein